MSHLEGENKLQVLREGLRHTIETYRATGVAALLTQLEGYTKVTVQPIDHEDSSNANNLIIMIVEKGDNG